MQRKQVDLTALTEEENQIVKSLIQHETKKHRVYLAYQKYLLTKDTILVFDQTLVVYKSDKDPNRFRAAVCELRKDFIDKGGFGTVHHVRGTLHYQNDDPDLPLVYKIKNQPKKRRAIKLSRKRTNQTHTEFFLAVTLESQFLADKHELIPIHHGKEVVIDGDYAYQLMRYLPGKTLFHFNRTDGAQLFIKDKIQIAILLTEALQLVHSRQIIHGDIRAENVMMCAENGTVRVFDFGLSRRHPTFSSGGSVEYAAPEVIALGGISAKLQRDDYSDLHFPVESAALREEYSKDVQSDIFSFGVLLAEFFGASLTREQVDEGDEIFKHYLFGALPEGLDPHCPVTLTELPKQIIDIVLPLLAIRKSNRPPLEWVHEKLHALLLEADAIYAPPTAIKEQIDLFKRRCLPNDLALIELDDFKKWQRDLRRLVSVQEGFCPRIQISVLSGVIRYLNNYATKRTLSKKSRAASSRRIDDMRELVGIACMNENPAEKEILVSEKLSSMKTGFFGRSQLRKYVQNSIKHEGKP